MLVFDSSGCSAGAEIRDILASVEEVTDNEWQLTVFPNPTTDGFVLQSSLFLIKEIEIFNLLGEKVFDVMLRGVEAQKLNPKLQQGIYFVRVSNGERNVVRKLIIE